MKFFIALLILFSTNLYAADWAYTTDFDGYIRINGHQVDSTGARLNNKTYTPSLNPETSTNLQAMGKVGFSRIFSETGYSNLGVQELTTLLLSAKWSINYSEKNITRLKDEGCSSCKYEYYIVGVTQFIPQNPYSSQDEVEKALQPYFPTSTYRYDWKTVPKGSTAYNPDSETYVLYIFDQWGSNNGMKAIAKPIKSDADKEYLTFYDLARYANKTHPDFKNQNFPALNSSWSHKIPSDLWIYGNKYEYSNSPAVQIVLKLLNASSPNSEDNSVKPDPETGGSLLPDFCAWATPVCDFFKEFMENPEIDNPDVPNKEIDTKEINPDLIRASGTICPSDIQVGPWDIPFGGSFSYTFSMQQSCRVLEPLKYLFQLLTAVFCAYLLTRI